MRLQDWLKMTLAAALIALCGRPAAAQYPDGGMMAPGMPGPAYAPMSGPGNLPPGYGNWPELSPFARSYEQYQNSDGVWSQNTNERPRRYSMSIDYLSGRTRVPESYIGNRRAQSYIDTITSVLGNQGQGGGGQQGQNNPLTLFGGQQNGRPAQQPHWQLFGALDLEGKGKVETNGTRYIFSVDSPDSSSMRFGFFYNAGDFIYDARALQTRHGRGAQRELTETILRSPDFDQIDIAPQDPSRILQNNLFILHGIPLDDGTVQSFPGVGIIGGVTAPYDLDFRVTLKSNLYSGNIEWAMSPIVDWKFVRVRPTVGTRYFLLRESFGFYGRDSGLAYGTTGQGGGGGGGQNISPDVKISSPPDGIDNDFDGIIDNAGTIEGGGQQGGQQNQQNQSLFVQVHFPDRFRYPITSFLNNDADSHLGGADIGLSYDFGGDVLQISGSSKVGLYANHERISMNGDNIAMHTRDNTLLLASPDNARPNYFTDFVTHTHVSPLFEQTLTAQAQIFHYVPVLRRIGLFEKAQFRFGYSFMYIGRVLEPSSSINWRGNPADTNFQTKGRPGLFPTINAEYGTYSLHNYNFGVSWSF